MLTSSKPSPLDYNDTLTNYPGIFNDVIGPVMRGSSSSQSGGGMMEIVEIDSIEVSMAGDYFETLIYVDSNGSEIVTAAASSELNEVTQR